MEEEIWKPIEGFDGYEICSIGNRVRRRNRSYKFTQWNSSKLTTMTLPDYEFKIAITRGYYSVQLTSHGKRFHRQIHRMKAIAFIANPNNYKEVNHLDGNKLNNSLSNLEWTDRKRNAVHAAENGLLATGERNGSAILQERLVRAIKIMIAKKYTLGEIAEIFETGTSTIHRIKKGTHWKHVKI